MLFDAPILDLLSSIRHSAAPRNSCLPLRKAAFFLDLLDCLPVFVRGLENGRVSRVLVEGVVFDVFQVEFQLGLFEDFGVEF